MRSPGGTAAAVADDATVDAATALMVPIPR